MVRRARSLDWAFRRQWFTYIECPCIETKGFQIPIVDHVLIRNSIALTGNDIANYTRNLGCANRMVNKVIVANTNENQGSTSMNNTFTKGF